jgi:hypothetical protein
MVESVFPGQPSQVDALTQINIQDFIAALGGEQLRRGRKLMEALCGYPARRFALQIAAFDRRVGEQGLQAAAHATLLTYVKRVEVTGQEHIPRQGPLLVLANHPGLSDTLALFSSLPRPDLRVLAGERPFLSALTQVKRHLIGLPDDPGRRLGAVRQVISHLRQGGAVLTFPAGQIEPDPACMPGAIESLRNWSESIALFGRRVPETQVVVAVVSGVVWEASLHHPITRLGRSPHQRHRIAATWQVLVQTLLPFFRPVSVRVAFSPAFNAGALAVSSEASLLQMITAQARKLMQSGASESAF